MAVGERPRRFLRGEEALTGVVRKDNDRSALRIAVLVALVGHGLLLGLVLPQMDRGAEAPPPEKETWVIRKHTPPPRVIDPTPRPPIRRPAVPLPEVEPAEFEPVRSRSGPTDLRSLHEIAHVPHGEVVEPPEPTTTVFRWAEEPTRIHYVEPEYTRMAQAAGLQGEVILDVIIDESGVVGDIEVLKPLSLGLTEAAIAAVEQWRYEPATHHGRPVPIVLTIRVRFRLE